MPSYKAPVDDVRFLLDDVFHIERYSNLPGFADASPDVIAAILEEAAKFCEHVLALGSTAVASEGWVSAATTPASPRRRVSKRPSGRSSRAVDLGAADACAGLLILTQLVNEFLCSANMAFAMYPGSAIAALIAHGSEEQKKAYLPKMIAGEWTGTRIFTEPHWVVRISGCCAPRRRSRPTAATRSPAPRSSFLPASTISRRTSFTWCSLALKARRKAPRESRCSSCRKS